jgi:hypothetical protein
MTTSISRPVRRVVAVVILLAVLMLGWLAVIEPLIDLSRDRRAEIAQLSEQLGLLRAMITRQPELVRRAAAEQAALEAEGGLWTGSSAAEVAAGMQDRLRQVITQNAGRLHSTAIVSQADEHGFRRVTVHFSIEGTLDTVVATLTAIEAARPGMYVDAMAVHATGTGGVEDPPGIMLDLDVTGYRREGAA